jgi:hypothetical protein
MKTPLSETLVQLCSFLLILTWGFARMQRSALPGSLPANPMPQEWNIALYLALFAVFLVFVRRMIRAKSVLRENLKDFREPKFPPMRGHGGGKFGA